MNPEALNTSIRKFLKTVGVNAQRAIEEAVAEALESGAIQGHETLPATMRLEITGIRLDVRYEGRIRLEE